MKTPSKWAPQGHAYTLPTDAATHRRVMLEARRQMVEADEDGDIRAAMAAFVAQAVEDAIERQEVTRALEVARVRLADGTEPGTRTAVCNRCLRVPGEACLRRECGQGTDR